MAIKLSDKYKKDLKKLQLFKKINIVIAVAIVISAIVSVFTSGIFLVLSAVLALDVLGVYLAYIKPKEQKLIDEGHYKLIEMLVNQKIPNSRYSYQKENFDDITPIDIYGTSMITKKISIETHNHIKSVCKGVPFNFCTFNGRMLNGCWFIFNCHIKMNSSLYVMSKNSIMCDEMRYKQSISSLLQIQTGNIAFDSMFDVFCYDDQTPKQILTDKLMNNLIALAELKNDNLNIYFNDGIVHIGVVTQKRFFVPMTFISDTFEILIETAKKDINYIKDYLNFLDFSDYVNSEYAQFKEDNSSIYYTGGDVDKTFYI